MNMIIEYDIKVEIIIAHYNNLLSNYSNHNVHALLITETFLKPSSPSSSYALYNFHLHRVPLK